jgi:lysophospholipid acyltransferase (LPLAT)-like uncharacterized protein
MRPGALWVAKLSGRPLVVLGVAARPAVRLPRWDHHLFPIPGARIAVVYGEPIMVGRQDEIDDNLTIRVATALNAAEEQARAIVRPSRLLKNSVSPPGRD